MEMNMFEELLILVSGIVLTLFTIYVLPRFVRIPGIGVTKVDYPHQNTSYKVYILYKKQFWVEGDIEFPEVVKTNVKRIKLSKKKIYALVKCNLIDGTYEYIFHNKGTIVKQNSWKQYLKDNSMPFQDFPSPAIMDAIFNYMPKQRRKRGITHAIPSSKAFSKQP
jgi:hypothetical protein